MKSRWTKSLTGVAALAALGIGYLQLTAPDPDRGPVARLKKELGEAKYQSLVIAGDPALADPKTNAGIFDPSLEYSRDGDTGWLAYSSITGDFKPVGPYVHTCLARSADHGRTWNFVARVNRSDDATLELPDGQTLPGAWRYEVSTLVRDEGAPEGDWKLFSHKYFWNPKNDRMFAYGWIVMRTAHDPAGPWSEEIPLFGAGDSPPAPYHRTRVDLNSLSPDLKHQAAYSEMGSLSHGGALYLSLGAMWIFGPDKIVLIKSPDHGKSWEYVGALATNDDARALGYSRLDGSSLVEEKGRFFLLVTPGSRKLMHDGTLALEIESLQTGKLKRDAEGKPSIAAYFPLQAGILSGPGGGQSDYDEHNTAGGLVIPQFDVKSYPYVFRMFSTGRGISGAGAE